MSVLEKFKLVELMKKSRRSATVNTPASTHSADC